MVLLLLEAVEAWQYSRDSTQQLKVFKAQSFFQPALAKCLLGINNVANSYLWYELYEHCHETDDASEVQRLIFKKCPLKYPVQKLLSTRYCCDPRRVCRCSPPWEAVPERFQETHPEIQGHRITLLFFFLRNCDSEICVQICVANIWQNQTFHFQESAFLELCEKQELCVLYHNGKFFQEKTVSQFQIWGYFEKLQWGN